MYFPQKFCPQTAVTFRVVRTQPLESAQLTTLMSVVTLGWAEISQNNRNGYPSSASQIRLFPIADFTE